MPSLFENKETIKYDDNLFLINQSVIPNTSATAGYLDKYGGDDGEKTYDGVRTSQDPDRANGSGTWKLEPIDSGSGPLKYGHKFRLVNQHVEAGYLEAFNGGEDIVVFGGEKRPLGRHKDGRGCGCGRAWQIAHNNITDNMQTQNSMQLAEWINSVCFWYRWYES